MRLGRIVATWFAAATLFGPLAIQAQQRPAVDDPLLKKVGDKLCTAARQVGGFEWPADYLWPPRYRVDPTKVVNAYSDYEAVTQGDEKRIQPWITVNQGWLDVVVKGSEDRLAEVMGHELSHILLRHITTSLPGTPMLALAVQRDRESAADLLGFKIALKAGYPYDALMDSYLRELAMERADHEEYNSFQGLSYDHPASGDRIAAVDSKHPEVGRAYSAFETGVQFLLYEQYPLAERCFEEVNSEMPTCFEGWANLGYTKLMRYCDKLSSDDLRRYNIGHLVTGGFYRQSHLLERGIDAQLWNDAVAALQKAIDLKPDLILPKGSLAIAYLVDPEGKKAGEAESLFKEIVEAIENGKVEALDPATRAALLVNAGVTEMSAGDSDRGQRFFDEAAQLLAGASGRDPDSAGQVGTALRYNNALRLASAAGDDNHRQAVKQFESFLSKADGRGLWWPLAYDRYVQLCQQLGVDARSQESFNHKREDVRPVVAITLPDGKTVGLTDFVDEVQQRLGPGAKDTIIQDRDLQRITYADRGLELIANDRVLGICVKGPAAPPVPVQVAGLDGDRRQLRVGMTRQEFEAALGNPDEIAEREFVNPDQFYRYYTDLGVGIKIASGTVVEIVIAQLAEKKSGAE